MLKSQEGIVVGEGLVNGHMGAAGRGGRYLWGPMFCCHSDLIRGPDQEEDQLSLSPPFDVHTHAPLQKTQGLLLFIMRTGGFVGEPLHQTYRKKNPCKIK